MTMRPPINFFHTHISPNAIERVNAVLRSGWVNEGEAVREFETELSRIVGVPSPVTVNSGTAALHLALVIAGVGPGDEVILPPQTFIATGQVILMQRATPVFADVDPATGNISVKSIAEKITPRTKAVMPVHWGGVPCDLDEINSLARQHGIAVVEDAAHALGATYKGKFVGAISRFTAFSFQSIKHVTSGDGGMLCCPDYADTTAARQRRWFGIDRTHVQWSPIGARGTDVSVLGFKYHMNNVAAALGLGNLLDFPDRLTRRRAIAARYRRELANVPGLKLVRLDSDRDPAYWFFTVLVERRLDFARKLAAAGVPASVIDLRIDRNSVFGKQSLDLPGQTEFDEHQIAIPVHEGLTDDDIQWIISTIQQGW